MNMAAQAFADYLAQLNHFGFDVEDDLGGLIKVYGKGENTQVLVTFQFYENDINNYFFSDRYFNSESEVTIEVMELQNRISKNKFESACIICSDLTSTYTGIKFFVAKDMGGSNIVVEHADAFIELNNPAKICFQYLITMGKIFDKEYPNILKGIKS